MAVAVDADLVASIGHRLHLLGEGLDRMPRDEPSGFYAYPLEHLEQPGAADLACEQAARDVVGRILAAIAAEPTRNGVNIDAEAAQDLLGHCRPPSSKPLER